MVRKLLFILAITLSSLADTAVGPDQSWDELLTQLGVNDSSPECEITSASVATFGARVEDGASLSFHFSCGGNHGIHTVYWTDFSGSTGGFSGNQKLVTESAQIKKLANSYLSSLGRTSLQN